MEDPPSFGVLHSSKLHGVIVGERRNPGICFSVPHKEGFESRALCMGVWKPIIGLGFGPRVTKA